MGNVFTLESMEEELEREFAPLTFQAQDETYVLRNLLRINKKDRQEVVEAIKGIESSKEDGSEISEDDAVAAMNLVFRKVTADGKGAKLVKLLGDDLPKLMKLMERWTEATQPGEAQDSPS